MSSSSKSNNNNNLGEQFRLSRRQFSLVIILLCLAFVAVYSFGSDLDPRPIVSKTLRAVVINNLDDRSVNPARMQFSTGRNKAKESFRTLMLLEKKRKLQLLLDNSSSAASTSPSSPKNSEFSIRDLLRRINESKKEYNNSSNPQQLSRRRAKPLLLKRMRAPGNSESCNEVTTGTAVAMKLGLYLEESPDRDDTTDYFLNTYKLSEDYDDDDPKKLKWINTVMRKRYWRRERQVNAAVENELNKHAEGRCFLNAFSTNYLPPRVIPTTQEVFQPPNATSNGPALITIGFYLIRPSPNKKRHRVATTSMAHKFLVTYYGSIDNTHATSRNELHMLFEDDRDLAETQGWIRDRILGRARYDGEVRGGRLHLSMARQPPGLVQPAGASPVELTEASNIRIYIMFEYLVALYKNRTMGDAAKDDEMKQSPRILFVDTRDVIFNSDESTAASPLSLVFDKLERLKESKNPFVFATQEVVPLRETTINRVWIEKLFQLFESDKKKIRKIYDKMVYYNSPSKTTTKIGEKSKLDREGGDDDGDDKENEMTQEERQTVFALNQYLDRLENSRTRLLPNQESNLPVLNSGVIGGDLIGMMQYFGMCRAVFECLRVSTSPLQSKKKPIYGVTGLDQGVFNFAAYFGTQFRARHLLRQNKKDNNSNNNKVANASPQHQQLVDFYVLDHRTGPIVHYINNPEIQMIRRRLDVARNKTVTEYLNCKGQTYGVVHQLDRHAELFYDY